MAAQRKVLRAGNNRALQGVLSRRKLRALVLPLLAGVVASSILLAALSARSEQNPSAPKGPATLSNSAGNERLALTTPKPEPKESNLESTQNDAAALSALADQLRDELNKMNANVLALDVIHKTEQVEKLARKIKGEVGKH